MSTQHFFLSSPAAAVPERLLEAFAGIKPLNAEALLARLPLLPAAQSLVWLSSTDDQWPQALRQILQAKPDARVVLLSGVPEPTEGLRALNDGARGYTHAYGVPALLQEVALVIEHGGLWVGPDLLQRLVRSTNAALAAQQAVSKAQLPETPHAQHRSQRLDAPVSARGPGGKGRVGRPLQQGSGRKDVYFRAHRQGPSGRHL